jgi:hypothetical protein
MDAGDLREIAVLQKLQNSYHTQITLLQNSYHTQITCVLDLQKYAMHSGTHIWQSRRPFCHFLLQLPDLSSSSTANNLIVVACHCRQPNGGLVLEDGRRGVFLRTVVFSKTIHKEVYNVDPRYKPGEKR